MLHFPNFLLSLQHILEKVGQKEREIWKMHREKRFF